METQHPPTPTYSAFESIEDLAIINDRPFGKAYNTFPDEDNPFISIEIAQTIANATKVAIACVLPSEHTLSMPTTILVHNPKLAELIDRKIERVLIFLMENNANLIEGLPGDIFIEKSLDQAVFDHNGKPTPSAMQWFAKCHKALFDARPTDAQLLRSASPDIGHPKVGLYLFNPAYRNAL